MEPKISVIVTCYNLEKYLTECIDSIKGQTIDPYEIILVHDGCQEPTAYTGVHTAQRESNLGVARTRDEGFRLSTGELLLFVDGDDALAENFLEMCLREIKKGADIAYPDVLVWRRWGENPKLKNSFHEVKGRITKERLLKRNEVVVTSLMQRQVYEICEGFDENLALWEDWAFWLDAEREGYRFRKANTVLRYRQRTQGRNQHSEDERKAIYAQIKEAYE